MSGQAVAIAADHAGFALKEELKGALQAWGYEVTDLGTGSDQSVDYPDFGHALAEVVSGGRADFGVAVCGSGNGIAMAVNRHPGVRAAVCHDITSARLSREHNDANVLAFGARLTGRDVALDCLKVFLNTTFEGGRHVGRVAKLG